MKFSKVMKITDMMEVALNDDENDIFVEYSPHTKQVFVKVYEGDWEKGKEHIFRDSVRLTNDNSDLELEKMLDKLKKL